MSNNEGENMEKGNADAIKKSRNTGSNQEILGKNVQNETLLVLDSPSSNDWIRSSSVGRQTPETESSSTSAIVCDSLRSDSEKNGDHASLRQSTMCESESFKNGNSSGEYSGRSEERHDSDAQKLSETMQIGASTDLENGQIKGQNEGPMSNLHQYKKSNDSTENKGSAAIQIPSAIELDSRGIILAKNNSELLRYCKALISSKQVPSWYSNPEQLFAALMFVRSLGLSDASIRQTAVINGIWSIFGDLPLALTQSSPHFESINEFWFDKNYNKICFENKNLSSEVFGAVCFLNRKNHEKQSFAFTLEEAKTAGLYPSSNPNKPWVKYTKLMLRYRARSIGLKSLFADKINGVAIAEYDFHENDPSKARDITPEGELANELNKI